MRFKIDWAGLILGRKFTVFLFYLVFEGNLQVQAPDLYLEGSFNGGFLRYEFGGLIFGGAYFRNFTVYFSAQQCFIATSVPGSSLTRNLHKQPTIMKSVYHLFNYH